MSPRAAELDLRQFSGLEELELNGEAGPVIADLFMMATAISSKGFDEGLRHILPHLSPRRTAVDIAASVAQHLTREVSGLKADVLRKAVQETMLDAAGLGSGPEELDMKLGLEKFLRKRGAIMFLERFLSSYVFNALWIRIQEAVREKGGSRSLSKSMLAVQRFCSATVRSVIADWQADGKLQGLAEKKLLADVLIQTIEARLLETS